MPYSISRNLTGNGALIKKVSHWDVNLNKGVKLTADFETPVIFKVDGSTEGREMPTLFVVPTFVAQKAFCDALLATGVENVDVYPAVIRDPATAQEWTNYFYVNVVGAVPRADIRIANDIEHRKTAQDHIFRLAEDKLRIVISDEVHTRLRDTGFHDVYFQPVDVRV